jgi:hypothetical protein
MADSQIILAAAALAGVAITLVANALRDWHDSRRTSATRWDRDLAGIASELLASARRVMHTARRIDRYPDRQSALRRLDTRHEELRALAPQVGLLGSLDVQTAARWILREAYAVREVGERRPDPHPGAAPAMETPSDRLTRRLQEFEVAVRVQLKVQNPRSILDESEFPS